MITYVDLAPIPHVSLLLRVPVPLSAGGWTWGEPGGFPAELAREFAYTDREARSLVHAYGRMVPVVVPRKALGDRFRVCARGLSTGLCVGLREWDWSEEAHGFKPAGEYMSGWREAVRCFYLRTGQFFEDRRFTPRAGCVPAPRVTSCALTGSSTGTGQAERT